MRCYGNALQSALQRRRYYEPAITALVHLVLPQCASADDLLRSVAPFTPGGATAHPPLLVLLAKAAVATPPLPANAVPIAEQLLAIANGAGDPEERAFVAGEKGFFCPPAAGGGPPFGAGPLSAPEGGGGGEKATATNPAPISAVLPFRSVGGVAGAVATTARLSERLARFQGALPSEATALPSANRASGWLLPRPSAAIWA